MGNVKFIVKVFSSTSVPSLVRVPKSIAVEKTYYVLELSKTNTEKQQYFKIHFRKNPTD